MVRENGTSGKNFLSVNFSGSSGIFYADDAAGQIALTNATYTANTEIAVLIEFDMDAGTSQMSVDGLPIFSNRSHGIVGSGVGSLLTGFVSGNAHSSFELDDLSVSGVVPLTSILDADFDDKVPGQPIGTGGAEVGEPWTIDIGLLTEVIEPVVGNPVLQLKNTSVGIARVLRWQFIDDLEVGSGVVVFDVDLKFAALDDYQVYIRESRKATSSFASLRFNLNGGIQLSDANGYVSTPPFTYTTGELYHLRMSYDLDNGTYSATLNDTLLVADREYGVTTGRGIGSIGFGMQSNASVSADFTIDALQVGAFDAALFPSQLNFLDEPTTGRANQSLTPVLEIGVVNIFDEALEDGMIVEVDIEDGPNGATISGASAPTVAGIARFDNLQVDTPGTYRLRVSTGPAIATSENDLVIPYIFNRVFNDGFEEEDDGPK